MWQNALLQLAGLAIIAWSAMATGEEELCGTARVPLILAIALIAWAALQSVPLPTAWLHHHGVRGRIADGLALLGQSVPSLSISVAPYSSLTALFCLVPPLAIYCAIVRLRAYRPSWLAIALVAGSMAGVVLGTMQVTSGSPSGRWYLYGETNIGLAVGFFANANHMAMLLVVSLPFLAALGTYGRGRERQRYWGSLAMLGGIATVLIAGILLNGSLAGFALTSPVLLGSAAIDSAGIRPAAAGAASCGRSALGAVDRVRCKQLDRPGQDRSRRADVGCVPGRNPGQDRNCDR